MKPKGDARAMRWKARSDLENEIFRAHHRLGYDCKFRFWDDVDKCAARRPILGLFSRRCCVSVCPRLHVEGGKVEAR